MFYPVLWTAIRKKRINKQTNKQGSDTYRPPACPLSQTHRQDRLQYTAPQLASAQSTGQSESCVTFNVAGQPVDVRVFVYNLTDSAYYKQNVNVDVNMINFFQASFY